MAKKKQTVAKVKKKTWLKIKTTELFRDKEIGESYVSEPESILGRTIKVNLMSLTGDPKKQNIEIKFQISSVKEEKAVADVISYSLLPTSIKRIVRRDKTRLDDSFLTKSKDGKVLRIKPLVVTRGIIRGDTKKGIRVAMKEFLVKKATSIDAKQMFEGIIFQKFQREMREILSKVYPLAACEVRKISIESGKIKAKPLTVEDVKVEPPTKEKKKKKSSKKEDEEEKSELAEEKPAKEEKKVAKPSLAAEEPKEETSEEE